MCLLKTVRKWRKLDPIRIKLDPIYSKWTEFDQIQIHLTAFSEMPILN